jgi:hypothetical protein
LEEDVLRSITKSAVLVLAVFALVGARGAPTAVADEAPERLSRATNVEARQYWGRCAKGHEREYQGETTCDHYCYDDTPGYGDDRWDPHYCQGDKEAKTDKPKDDKAKDEKPKDEKKDEKPEEEKPKA